MKSIRKMIVLLGITAAVTGLTGCGNPASKIVGKIDESVIGEGSGSGELISAGRKTFESVQFDIMRVSVDAMAIYVARSEDGLASVELLTDKAIKNRFSFDASVQSRTLELSVKEESTGKSKFSFKDQKGERKLLITLPEKTYEQIVVKSGFGRIEVGDLQADQINMSLNAGAIRLNRVSGTMKLGVDAGDIELQDIPFSHDLSAETSAGDVRIQLAELPEAIELDLASEVGKVSADLPSLDYETKTHTRVIGALGSAGPKLHVRTEVGSIQVDAQ